MSGVFPSLLPAGKLSGPVILTLESEAKAKKSVYRIISLRYRDLWQKNRTLLGITAALRAETKDIFNVICKER